MTVIAGKPVCRRPNRINHVSRFVPTLDTAMRGMTSVCSIVISARSEALRSPARHLVDHEESGRGGLRIWSRRVSLRNLEENPVAGESGADAAAISRSAYAAAVLAPPIRCDRYVSIPNPRGRRHRRGRCRGRDPQNDGASQEGATPKPGAVRGTHVGGPRNAGVQGGTESSNLLCSSSQSVSAVNAEALREKPCTLAAFCGWRGT